MANAKKLSDQEFHEIVPTLPIAELFLIEIKKGNQWLKFCEFDGGNLICNVCNRKLFLPAYSSHCTSAKHRENLKSFQRIYHPRRTQPKSPTETISANYLKTLEERAKEKAKNLTALAQRIFARTLDKKIRVLCLKTNVRDVRQVFVNAGLPLNQLTELEYQTKQGEWRQLLTAERLNINSKFFCVLCSVYCAGVITVGAHFGGNSHMILQLGSLGVRHKTYRTLTKNCRFFYNATFILNVSEAGRKFYKAKAEKWLEEVQNQSTLNELEQSDNNDLLLSNEDLGLIDEIVQSIESSSEETSPKNNKKKSADDSVSKKTLDTSASAKNRNANKEADSADITEKEGLIGVEYVVKLLKTKGGIASIYECVLCEVVCNDNRMQQHLISYDHRLKYCDMHFSDTMKKYKNMVGHMRYQQFVRVMSPLLSKLASAIEGFHSRALPAAVVEAEFLKKRADYLADIYSYRHACQSHGPSFSKTVSPEQIEKFRNNQDSYKDPIVSIKSCYRFTTVPKRPYLEVFSYNMEDRLERELSSLKSSPPSTRVSGERDKKRSSHHRSRSPSSRAKKRERSPSPHDIWKQYDKEVGLEKKRIEREYSNYRKQPENHPLYEREWNRFWKQRKDELIAEGIDHRTYNYQAEWVHYFKNRLEELYCEAVREIKNTVRMRLNITADGNKDKHHMAADEAVPAKMPLMMTSAFGIEQLQPQEQVNAKIQLQQAQISALQQRIAMAPAVVPVPVPVPVPAPSAVSVASNSSTVGSKPQYEAPVRDDKPNVIHALRLLTAMEDHLGSLGSKIMDLFSKALQLEKKCNNNSALLEKCVLTSDNCNLLEVAMEKLKGVLFAGLLEGNKAQSFNRIIKTTEDLLTYAESRGWRDSCIENSPENSNNASIELQKLINALQNKSAAPAANIQQKSLSDTLKQLMAGKSKEREAASEALQEASMNSGREHFNSSLNTSFQSPSSSYEFNRIVTHSKAQIDSRMKSDDMNLQDHSSRGQLQRNDFNYRNRSDSSPLNDMNFGRESNTTTQSPQITRITRMEKSAASGNNDGTMNYNFSSNSKTDFPNQIRNFNASSNNMQMMQGFSGGNNMQHSHLNPSGMASSGRSGNQMFLSNNTYNPNFPTGHFSKRN